MRIRMLCVALSLTYSLVDNVFAQPNPPTATPAAKPAAAPKSLEPAPKSLEPHLQSTLHVQAIILQIDNVDEPKEQVRKLLDSHVIDSERMNHLGQQLRSIKGVTVLSRPTMSLVSGLAGSFFVGEEKPLEYMERGADGTYRLMATEPLDLGLGFSATATLDQQSKKIRLDPIELKLTALEGREKAEGTSLPVGKPRIAKRSVSSTVELAPNELELIELPISESRQVWIWFTAHTATEEAK